MAVYFFNKSWVSESGISASSSGGSDVVGHLPAKVYDYDKITYWENDGATPSLIIDLGVARLINSLWMYQDNIDDFDLYYSSNGSDWTKVADGTQADKGDGIWWFFDFTDVTKRYWKITVTSKVGAGNVKIYELMLLELRLTLSEDVDLPSMVVVTPKDMIGGSYPLVDGSVTSYAGIREYSSIEIEFKNVPELVYDGLYLLYSIPLRYPLVILPDDDKPDKIYRCLWDDTDFNLHYDQPLKLSGFSGTLKFMEY